MTTRDQLTQEKLDALLRLLQEIYGISDYRELQQVADIGQAQQVTPQRQKAVSQIVSDYQTARSSFDDAVTDFENASTVTEEFAAVVAATQAQQSQIDEIVEFLVLTNDSLGGTS